MLETRFPDITVEGEISNFRPSSTGHYYFSLKDDDSIISAVMFRNRISKLKFKPENGQLVSVRGNISVYAKRGSYQIICESMEIAGRGAILAMLEERKKKLAQEGLFDEDRKKKLPIFPKKIALVTSPTGAALRDIFRVLKGRNSGINLTLLPAPVQGNDAAEIIARQIRCANEYNLGEVLIVGRGGGSLEDLLPFSEEVVIRSIAESRLPVISAVGHEIDYALSDYVADRRAATPSAAAEIVSQRRDEILQKILDCSRIFLDEINGRMKNIRILQNNFTAANLERNFRICIQPLNMRFDDAKENLIRNIGDQINTTKHHFTLLQNGLSACSPYGILERGYAIVTKEESNTVITDKNQVSTGDGIKITVRNGNFRAGVKE